RSSSIGGGASARSQLATNATIARSVRMLRTGARSRPRRRAEADELPQDLDVRGLHDVLVETGAARARTVVLGGPAGERGEIDSRSGTFAKLARDVVAAHAGQADVDQRDIGIERASALERLGAGVCERALVTQRPVQ